MGLMNIFMSLSTFLQPAPLISKIDQISGMLGFEPEAAGREAWMLPLCYGAPQLGILYYVIASSNLQEQFQRPPINYTASDLDCSPHYVDLVQ